MRVNIIDTPGHVDFTAEVERSLRVLDGAIFVFCGVAGVQPQSETVWRQADKYGVPRIAFVNKMDRTGANFATCRRTTSARSCGANAWPILIPIGAEDLLKGQIDVINKKAIVYFDNDKLGSTYEVRDLEGAEVAIADKAYDELVEALCDVDDELGTMFLEEKPITVPDVKAALRRAVIDLKGSSRWSAVPPSRTRACSISSMPSSITSRARSTFRRRMGQDPDDTEDQDRSDPGRQRQVRLARVQAVERQVRRQARVLPRLLRHASRRATSVYNPAHPQHRARRPPDPDPGERAHGHRHAATPATSPRWSASRTSPPATRSAEEDYDILLEPPTFPEPVI